MEAFRTIEVKRSIFDNNDRQAEQLRRELKEKRVFLLNLMSSPGFRQDDNPAADH